MLKNSSSKSGMPLNFFFYLTFLGGILVESERPMRAYFLAISYFLLSFNTYVYSSIWNLPASAGPYLTSQFLTAVRNESHIVIFYEKTN